MARKVASILVALCLSVVVSLAGEKHAKMDAAGHVAKLKAELNLNTEQAARVEGIFADMEPIQTRWQVTHDELKALRSAGGSDAAAITAKEGELKAIGSERHALFAERDTALGGILTAEQFAKFQELAAAHTKKGMQGGHGGHGGQGGHGGHEGHAN